MFNFGKKNSQNSASDTPVDVNMTDQEVSNNSDTPVSTPQDTNQDASGGNFTEKPLNQIVTDPESWQTITRWKCSKCKFQYEGTSNPDKCPNCGAGREFFMEIG